MEQGKINELHQWLAIRAIRVLKGSTYLSPVIGSGRKTIAPQGFTYESAVFFRYAECGWFLYGYDKGYGITQRTIILYMFYPLASTYRPGQKYVSRRHIAALIKPDGAWEREREKREKGGESGGGAAKQRAPHRSDDVVKKRHVPQPKRDDSCPC